MNDTSIACFLSVARTGSFTVSAGELSSTQQAVSRNVQSLEEELGFSLLDRSGRATSLTWEGERFLRWCIEFDRQLTAARSAAARLTGDDADTLRLGWLDWTGCPPELADAIQAFSQTYPGCRIDVRQGNLDQMQEGLQDGTLDLAILPEYNTHNMSRVIMSEPFMEMPLYAVTHERYAFSSDSPTPSDLTPLKLLAADFGGSSDEDIRARIRFFCAPLGIYPENLEIMPNTPSTISELPCGPCYTIAPKSSFALRRGDLRFYPLPASAPLVFARSHGNASAWVPLFESFVAQQRRDRS